jgi:hypothetical protein
VAGGYFPPLARSAARPGQQAKLEPTPKPDPDSTGLHKPADSKTPLFELLSGQEANAAVFSPEGKLLATDGGDYEGLTLAKIRDAPHGEVVAAHGALTVLSPASGEPRTTHRRRRKLQSA